MQSSAKEKTSITLSPQVLSDIDQLAGSGRSRSAIIEDILRQYLRDAARARIAARDLEKINQSADELNAEAADVLECQAGGKL